MTETEASLAKLWTRVMEMSSALWGDDVKRDNGIRSKVAVNAENIADLTIRLDADEARIQHYLDKKREETCLGKILITEHLEDHETMEKLKKQMDRQFWQGVFGLGGSVLTLGGVLFASWMTYRAQVTAAQIMAQVAAMGIKP